MLLNQLVIFFNDNGSFMSKDKFLRNHNEANVYISSSIALLILYPTFKNQCRF